EHQLPVSLFFLYDRKNSYHPALGLIVYTILASINLQILAPNNNRLEANSSIFNLKDIQFDLMRIKLDN
ncbi:hypothetical protein, partial [Rickettsiella grylli]|uniref:hypothetical protein n=1 Tax=Rickettsiella grylli TaxID=59196 RepID=UPI000A46A377